MLSNKAYNAICVSHYQYITSLSYAIGEVLPKLDGYAISADYQEQKRAIRQIVQYQKIMATTISLHNPLFFNQHDKLIYETIEDLTVVMCSIEILADYQQELASNRLRHKQLLIADYTLKSIGNTLTLRSHWLNQ